MGEETSRAPRVVFTDVDGTLLGAGHRVLPEAAPTIELLGRQGGVLVLVSARMPEALYPIQRALDFSGPLVCYGGAYVLGERGEELLSRPIERAQAAGVLGFLSRELPEVCCSAYGFHRWVAADRTDPRIAREERIVGCEAESARGPLAEAFDERGLHKLLLMGEPDQIATAERRVSEAFGALRVVRSSDILCEVMSGQASKSEGVRVVCEHLGLSLADAVAFGDGRNDVGMLRSVPQSYAMANAPADVRAAAAHVTVLDNEHNGLAVELARLMGSPESPSFSVL